MTEFTMSTGRVLFRAMDWRVNPHWWRIVVLLVIALLLLSEETRQLTAAALSDAYLAVTVFVAATLGLVNLIEAWLRIDVGTMLARSARWQPFVAALLGAMPGCGGAIIVITQYTRGNVTFGGVVSVLVATMGDAAFLLIAREPGTASFVMLLGIAVGTVSGLVVDRIHGTDFLHEDSACRNPRFGAVQRYEPSAAFFSSTASVLWLTLLGPGIVLGVLGALQIDADVLLGALAGPGMTEKIGVVGAVLSLSMWAFASHSNSHTIVGPRDGLRGNTVQRTIADTNFVTGWVVLAFLAFELSVHFLGIDLKGWFGSWVFLTPLIGMLIGLIPGCGPQILVTSLYLAGAIPLSAQLSNAIANDGDALFPAIALAPRAALVATLYSSVPALIVGYGYFFLAEF